MYLYRAVDSEGNTIDFHLSESRDKEAAKRFFKKAFAASHNRTPRVITVDKNPAYPVAIQELKDEESLPEDIPIRQSPFHLFKSFFSISFSARSRFNSVSVPSGRVLGLPLPGPFALPLFSSKPFIPSSSKRFTHRRMVFVSIASLSDTVWYPIPSTRYRSTVNRIYGYRRVKVWLNRTYQLKINHKRVQRLMKEMGMQAVIRKKRPYYGKKEAYVISENHLNRNFKDSKPNEKWVTDITYMIFNGQRLYLSASKDLYNNEIVSYQISRRNDLKLVMDTIKKARKKRIVSGVLLHSDQGFQYTSRQYNHLLKRNKIKASMSRKGNCWDNACIENFFSHFKSECFNLFSFRSAEEVKQAVQKYIRFYNHQRFQKKLNNLTPYEFRNQAA